jgi:hypothetical protein
MMCIAPKGQRLTQIPQPMHRPSLIVAIFACLPTSMHSLPDLLRGHTFLHSRAHLSGRHLSLLMMPILIRVSTIIYEHFSLRLFGSVAVKVVEFIG